MSPRLNLIVARAKNGVIGWRNALPWHIPEELKYFKASTMGHVLIMGRKTFDSIGRPLPGRQTVVVTRNAGWSHAGCHAAGSLDQALDIAGSLGSNELFIAGGAQLFELALPRADRLLITEVDVTPDGDAFFPTPAASVWLQVAATPQQSSNGTRYTLTEYRRR